MTLAELQRNLLKDPKYRIVHYIGNSFEAAAMAMFTQDYTVGELNDLLIDYKWIFDNYANAKARKTSKGTGKKRHPSKAK